jgi:hypothetical protein
MIQIFSEKKDQARRLSGALYGAADKNGANLTNYAACGRRDVRHIPTRQQSNRLNSDL